jgi:SpoIID/LytB domain protein
VAVPAENGTVELPVRQRRYRGVMEATATSGTLRLVNAVDVETYLKGMGEVRDPSWPPAALRSQAIAARTYAMRAMAVGGEVCDTQRCQVYLGAQAEYGAMNRAVDDTREQVLVFNRSMISAVYSANGGGHSASRTEGFGVAEDASAPYLRAAPYPTQDPGPWSVTVALTDVGARLGYPGSVTDVRVTRTGPSGRAIDVTLEGSAGPKVVTGIAFDAALGLRSTLFTLRVEAGAAPPPPPPAEEVVVQAPPEEAAAAVAVEIVGPTEARTPAPAGRVVGTPPPGADDGEEVSMTLLLVAAGVLAAVAGGVWVRFLSPSRLRPSPSAPPSEDGSP